MINELWNKSQFYTSKCFFLFRVDEKCFFLIRFEMKRNEVMQNDAFDFKGFFM